jgi:hemolysin-activating ACP:hemolysin acyltransferase
MAKTPAQAAPANNSPARPPQGPTLSKEQIAAVGKEMYAGFGQIVTVLMRSSEYHTAPLSTLESLVVPAVVSSQFSIATMQRGDTGLSTPQAIVLWAHVSEAIDRRLATTDGKPKLQPVEWTSGSIPWVVEVAGQPRAATALLRNVVEKRFAKTGLKIMQKNSDGHYKVTVLKAAPAKAAATS